MAKSLDVWTILIEIIINVPMIRLLKATASLPVTYMVFLFSFGLFFFFYIWFQPTLLMTLAAGLLSLVLVAIWPIFLIRSGHLALRLGPLTAEATAARGQRLERLRADLAKVEAHQGIAQLELLDQKLVGLMEVLRRRLNAGELTQLRYLDTAEQVYLSATDNLHEIYIALTSIGTIDRERIDRRLSELRALGSEAAPAIAQIDALSQSRSMLEKQTARVEALFAQNEQAMTALDHAATALADARIKKGEASVDIDHALKELEILAKRAGSYIPRHKSKI